MKKVVYTVYNSYNSTNFLSAVSQFVTLDCKKHARPLEDAVIILPNVLACSNLRDKLALHVDKEGFAMPSIVALNNFSLKSFIPTHYCLESYDVFNEHLLYLFFLDAAHALKLKPSIAKVAISNLNAMCRSGVTWEEFSSHLQAIGQKSLFLVLERWFSYKESSERNGGGKVLSIYEELNVLISCLRNYIQDTDIGVYLCGSTGSVAATRSLMNSVALRDSGGVVFFGLSPNFYDTIDSLPQNHPQQIFLNTLHELGNPKIIELETDLRSELELGRSAGPLGVLRSDIESCVWGSDLNSEFMKNFDPSFSSVKKVTVGACANCVQEIEYICYLTKKQLASDLNSSIYIIAEKRNHEAIHTRFQLDGIVSKNYYGRSLRTVHFIDAILKIIILSKNIPIHDKYLVLIDLLKNPYSELPKRDFEALCKLEAYVRNNWTAKGISQILTECSAPSCVKRLLDQAALVKPGTVAFLLDQCTQLLRLIFSAETILEFEEFLDKALCLSSRSDFYNDRNVYEIDSLESIVLQASSFCEENLSKDTQNCNVVICSITDARFVECDLVVLANFNEGHLPKTSGESFLPEKYAKAWQDECARSGLDFCNLLQARNIHITRSNKTDGSASEISRFGVMFEAFLSQAEIEFSKDYYDFGDFDGRFDGRPEGCDTLPSKHGYFCNYYTNNRKNAKNIAITKLSKFINNPFYIYCYYILKLKPIPFLNYANIHQSYGIFAHKVIEVFTKRCYASRLSSKADYRELFINILQEVVDIANVSEFIKYSWRSRMVNFAETLSEKEHESRVLNGAVVVSELRHSMELLKINESGSIVVTGVIDRVEFSSSGISVTDYKTGAVIAKKDVYLGKEPQLPMCYLLAKDAATCGIYLDSAGNSCIGSRETWLTEARDTDATFTAVVPRSTVCAGLNYAYVKSKRTSDDFVKGCASKDFSNDDIVRNVKCFVISAMENFYNSATPINALYSSDYQDEYMYFSRRDADDLRRKKGSGNSSG